MLHTCESLQQLLDSQIASLLPETEQPRGLYDPMRYVLEDGGKRMRPLLCLLACNVYGQEPVRALASAVAVEVFHNFTLLHDDIMDRAEVRRGRPTVHRKWGESGAILSGDAMLILAYQILCGERLAAPAEVSAYLPEWLEVFSRAAMQVCQGQQYDMEFESRSEVTMEEYLDMIRLKTAVLMAASLELGAIAGGASALQRRAIYDFGIHLGLAFQIQDDLLDTYGDPAAFGKQIGGDILAGKKTFLHLTAFGRASTAQRAALLDTDTESIERLERVRAVYDQLEVRSATEMAITHHFEKALSLLQIVADSPDRLTELERYAHSLVQRNR